MGIEGLGLSHLLSDGAGASWRRQAGTGPGRGLAVRAVAARGQRRCHRKTRATARDSRPAATARGPRSPRGTRDLRRPRQRWSRDAGHATLVTRRWSRDAGHATLVTRRWSRDAGNATLVTRRSSRDAGHVTLVTWRRSGWRSAMPRYSRRRARVARRVLLHGATPAPRHEWPAVMQRGEAASRCCTHVAAMYVSDDSSHPSQYLVLFRVLGLEGCWRVVCRRHAHEQSPRCRLNESGVLRRQASGRSSVQASRSKNSSEIPVVVSSSEIKR